MRTFCECEIGFLSHKCLRESVSVCLGKESLKAELVEFLHPFQFLFSAFSSMDKPRYSHRHQIFVALASFYTNTH